jgi:hypothetical protein
MHFVGHNGVEAAGLHGRPSACMRVCMSPPARVCCVGIELRTHDRLKGTQTRTHPQRLDQTHLLKISSMRCCTIAKYIQIKSVTSS